MPKADKIKMRRCVFVEISDVVPEAERLWFWEKLNESSNPPFSWGGNNRSMVTASSLANHCREMLDDSARASRILEKLRRLGETYVDLEN
ncbi:MAG: hypothetical protein NT118_05645 [Lentisphaerae bacterium]|nr:hypothetical protein [Lentisphaerota bacterium]